MLRMPAQLILYALFAGVTGYFSAGPIYQAYAPDAALLRLAFTHAAERRKPCRQRSPEELAAMAANMRRPEACERARLPLHVELELDGELLYAADEPPAGLWDDGPSTVYEKFVVPAGRHEIEVRLRDRRDTIGFDYRESRDIELAPGQNLVIAFRPGDTGFTFDGLATAESS